jgi:hypothetical protein
MWNVYCPSRGGWQFRIENTVHPNFIMSVGNTRSDITGYIFDVEELPTTSIMVALLINKKMQYYDIELECFTTEALGTGVHKVIHKNVNELISYINSFTQEYIDCIVADVETQ